MEGVRYRLIRVSRQHSGSGQYLEPLMQRIGVMSSQFDGAGSTLVVQTYRLYADGTPYLGLWAAVDEHNEVVGHALGDIEFWNGRMVAWVSQVKMDGPAGYALKEVFMFALDAWVREANDYAKQHNQTWQVSEVMMMTPRMTEGWARHSGFDVYRTVYRRNVRGGV